jgi:hypothetical protein
MHDHDLGAPAPSPSRPNPPVHDVRALARAADLDRLPDAALLPAADVRALCGGVGDDTLARLVADGLLPAPVRLRGGRGSSPRLWPVGEIRAFLARVATTRGAA